MREVYESHGAIAKCNSSFSSDIVLLNFCVFNLTESLQTSISMASFCPQHTYIRFWSMPIYISKFLARNCFLLLLQ